MDRISQLPESVVHNILSLFKTSPPAELVRMSVLSKTWFHLTASFPFLDFNMDDFTSRRFGDFTSRRSFFKYVRYSTSRFCHQHVPAYRFVLSATIQEPAELYIVDRCLRLLLNNGVRELEINLVDISESHPAIPRYRLPHILLSVSELKSLTIRDCNLPSSLMLFDTTVKFKSLVQLKLANVQIDDEVIKYLTTSCPLLQIFHIERCPGFKSFCVYGHQNLEQVKIEYSTPVERIDIEAPKLSTLLVADYIASGPPQMNFASCKKLTSVTYYGYSDGFTNFLSHFPFVEKLVLIVAPRCDNLKLSSNSLRTLQLRSSCALEEIELSTPNLGLFDYNCNAWYRCPVIRRLPHLTPCMRCFPEGSIDALWFQKLRLFMEKKNGFKAFNLYIHTDRKFIVLEKPRAVEFPLYELGHIELHFQHKKSWDHAAFVDAVLWYFRPRSLTLITSIALTGFKELSNLVKFTYEKLLEQEDQGHTNIQIVSSSSSKAQKNFRGLMLSPCHYIVTRKQLAL